MHILHFHKQRILEIIGVYIEDFPASYVIKLGDNATNEQLESMSTDLHIVLKNNSDNIMLGIGGEIHRYIDYYSVDADKGPDQYKLVYFSGMALARFLEREGHTLCAKVILRSMIEMLDYCLKDLTSGRGRPELKERLNRLIDNGMNDECLGKHGIYVAYKCASNILEGRTAKKRA